VAHRQLQQAALLNCLCVVLLMLLLLLLLAMAPVRHTVILALPTGAAVQQSKLLTMLGCDICVASSDMRPMLMRLLPLLALPGEPRGCSMIFTATVTAFQRPASSNGVPDGRRCEHC
jgi:hypothetical protein